MATAKQIAWRTKFAAMAKAGTLKKRKAKAKAKPARKHNPAPKTARRRAPSKPARVAKRVELLKPKRAPAKRKRNPTSTGPTLYAIRRAGGSSDVTYATTEGAARRTAQRLADASKHAHEIRKVAARWTPSARR